MARTTTPGYFEEGWGIWRFGASLLGLPLLGPPLSNNTYTLPAQ